MYQTAKNFVLQEHQHLQAARKDNTFGKRDGVPHKERERESESESEMYLFDPHKKCIQSNNEKI